MNNSQFRQLISSSPNQQTNNNNNNASSTPRPTGSSTPSGAALGAKKSSFIPMTPRSLGGGSSGVDFARQVRERNAALNPSNPSKKFKSSAPKGVKYGAGYVDRAKARADAEKEGEEDDKAARVKALEEQVKLGQIPRETFEALRDRITGGEAGATHLVKGLDWALLERVRRGEDVMGTGEGSKEEGEEEVDVDDELEKLGERDVQAVEREKVAKKGNMAPPPPVAGRKRTRDEIMAELKAQRQAAAEARIAAEPVLNERWSRVGEKKKPKIEIDEKGREVMITVDENGKVKKRVRKQKPAEVEEAKGAMGAPDASKAVLGADVSIPELAKQTEAVPEPEDDEDDDIFEGAGTDYNPLGNMPDDDDSDDSDDSDLETRPSKKKLDTAETSAIAQGISTDEESDATPPPAPNPPSASADQKPSRRDYFNDTPSATSEAKPDHLAGIHEVLKKAAKMDSLASANDNEEEGREAREARLAREKKRAQMLANQDRDLEDMDMGFGGDRYDDEGEDEDGKKVKLAEWKGGKQGDDGWEEDGSGGKGGEKRKRKPKKRKGDASSMNDIMKVIEGRKGGEKK